MNAQVFDEYRYSKDAVTTTLGPDSPRRILISTRATRNAPHHTRLCLANCGSFATASGCAGTRKPGMPGMERGIAPALPGNFGIFFRARPGGIVTEVLDSQAAG